MPLNNMANMNRNISQNKIAIPPQYIHIWLCIMSIMKPRLVIATNCRHKSVFALSLVGKKCGMLFVVMLYCYTIYLEIHQRCTKTFLALAHIGTLHKCTHTLLSTHFRTVHSHINIVHLTVTHTSAGQNRRWNCELFAPLPETKEKNCSLSRCRLLLCDAHRCAFTIVYVWCLITRKKKLPKQPQHVWLCCKWFVWQQRSSRP